MGEEGDLLRIVQENKICPHEQVAYAQPRSRLREWNTLSSQGFWDTNKSLVLGQTK